MINFSSAKNFKSIKKKKKINNYIDVGAHKVLTDLIIKNFKTKLILMFEPQDKIFNFIKDKCKNNENVKIFNKALSEKKRLYIFILINTTLLHRYQL